MKKGASAGLFLLVFGAALLFRLPRLGLRPLHHDEANQALKFGALLELGEYYYDKADHHGPSLYYLSLPFAWVFSAKTLAGLSETTLRLVTVSFGLGTILLFLLFIPLLGRASVIWGGLALALSPVMVYFSRFYIQETLLVFFIVGFVAALWRYRLRPSWGSAGAAGLLAGMMYATKETAVIAFAAIAGAFLLTFHPRKKTQEKGEGQTKRGISRSWGHLALALGVALLVSFVLFTSFFHNPKGFVDSLLSFRVYFIRAGEAGFHVHPWYYYLRLLAFSRASSGPIWSEALIFLLAVAGSIAAFAKRRGEHGNPAFLKFNVFYTVLAAAFYSLLPYKTPWNLLPFYIGFILLAGSGAAALVKACRGIPGRIALLLVLAAGFLHLGLESYRANFVYPADPRNPYVYAQTSPDFLRLIRRVEDLAAVHPDHRQMLIKVIADPHEMWPLPWYLRRFGRVGYWQDAAAAGAAEDAGVIISDLSQASRLEPALQDRYITEYYGLRPNVFLLLHVRNDLWEEFLKARAGT
jgi:uncharacterized protein (TIGR03663 family)